MPYFLQQLANSLPAASLYAALAFGYALIFGITRRADISYGALYAFSGQVLLLFANFAYNGLWLVMPAALACGCIAALLYGAGTALVNARHVMRPLFSQAANGVLVAALGIAIFLMEMVRLAADSHLLWLPPLLDTQIVFFSANDFHVVLTQMQLIETVGFWALVWIGAVALKYTILGRVWRAVADDPDAAALCGINAGRVFVITYSLAGLIAASCGVLATLYYGTMDFGAGLFFSLKILMVAAVGGYSNPMRSAMGAALLGVTETLWAAYASYLWRDAAIFSLLVLLLVLSRRERLNP
ncbi:branched-chain amino acid ABC transporter permease [Oryzifoliimicrobium ureilyticus]|uniref:branched-chain amino acid ABC transporter permease n=1 Tax=Oryzifoliimicrobium ureilyticus TaxID=3113724 RepID=UPI0030760802